MSHTEPVAEPLPDHDEEHAHGEIQPDGTELLKVSGRSNAHSLASALAHSIYEGRRPKVRAIGAGAVNQAVKALAIAAGFVASRGIQVSFRPGFDTVWVKGESMTAIVFYVDVK